jgi:hypothetical protein
MRRTDLDHMLEAAVAKALGVKLPRRLAAAPRTARKTTHRPVRHAA